jgi:hypothetical protein
MIVEVYHLDAESNEQVLVAKVTSNLADTAMALEYAYERTNNIEGSWSKPKTFMFEGKEFVNKDYSPNVEVVAPLPVHKGVEYGHRSSMMGDKFVIEGKEYFVAMFGFNGLE